MLLLLKLLHFNNLDEYVFTEISINFIIEMLFIQIIIDPAMKHNSNYCIKGRIMTVIVRKNIYNLQTVRKSKKDIESIQDEIIKSIRLPVYCYLADLNYLVDKNYFQHSFQLLFLAHQILDLIFQILL